MRINKNKVKNILMLQVVFFIYSIISVISKKASNYGFFTKEFLLLYSLEIFIFGMYAICWQAIIKRIDLSIAYANRGMIILWIMVWSVIFYNEVITINNLMGTFIIILGIFVVVRDE